MLFSLAAQENDEELQESDMQLREGEEEDDAHDDEEKPMAQPRNKSELYALFGKKGPTTMVLGFMEDRQLQNVARIIVGVSSPLEAYFYAALEKLRLGWDHQKEWVSDRACGAWLAPVRDTMKVLGSAAFQDSLHFTKPLRLKALDIPHWISDEWAKTELALMKIAFAFATALAENILWSNARYWWSLPELLATQLHIDPSVHVAGMQQVQDIVQAIVSAEKHECGDKEWRELLDDLGWHKQQLPREAMALVVQCGFKVGSSEVLQLSKRLFVGSPSTKECLENTFAFLHRKAITHSTNFKMSDCAKFVYAITSPYSEAGGTPQVLPSSQDFSTILSPQGQATREWLNKHLFSPQKSIFPAKGKSVIQSAEQIYNSKWRNAGVGAQQRSAAAAAYLVADAPNNFRNVDACWAGTLVFCESWFFRFVELSACSALIF